MYIPTQLFGSRLSPVSASGGDVIDTFTWEGTNYKYHAFLTTGSSSYVIHSGSAPHKLVVVGAGGSGGLGIDTSLDVGGGGAGGFIFLKDLPLSSGSYDLFVGAGYKPIRTTNGHTCSTPPFSTNDSAQGVNGESSWFQLDFIPTSDDNGYYLTGSRVNAFGGGAGGCQYIVCEDDGTSIGINGQSGASGGGGALYGDGTAIPKSVLSGNAAYNLNGQAPHGFKGGEITGSTQSGLGGGGASDTGSANNDTSEAGGAGVNIYSRTGLNFGYSVGGTALNGVQQSGPPDSGSGGTGVFNTPNDESKGRDGVVLVIYPTGE